MSQGKQQLQHQPAGGPAFWNITHNLKPGELESDMIKMLYSTGIDLQKENEALKARIQRLRREVELLRLYGNKDCTAQADEVLKKEDKP